MNEADTCRKFVVPKLQAAGWDDRPHAINEQRTFTDGRVVFIGGKARRGKQKRSDYLLRYHPDFPIAVVEAKSRYRHAAEGLQQAKEYAEILGLRFAYSTNEIEIVEFDYTTGIERTIGDFPAPDDLWSRLRRAESIFDDQLAERLLTPTFPDRAKPLRYYQEIAINRAVQAALQGRKRTLLTLCTGTGKTAVAFQICWKLWSAAGTQRASTATRRSCFSPTATSSSTIRWPRTSARSAMRATRSRAASRSRAATCISRSTSPSPRREPSRPVPRICPGLLRPHHRRRVPPGQRARRQQLARDPRILRARHPDRHDRDAAARGEPRHLRLLRRSDLQIQPARRASTTASWRPTACTASSRTTTLRDGGRRGASLIATGARSPTTSTRRKDFERVVALRARTQAIARHLAGFMAETDRFAKTIVFCVDQEHALEMRQALVRT